MRSRYLFHICEAAPERWPYAPPSLAREGFIHTSLKVQVPETVAVHYQGKTGLHLLCIDPRRAAARTVLADTPRGKMPHLHGPLPREAVVKSVPLSELESCPETISGTRIGLVAFRGMTLLDLVGIHDPVSRIATMGLDPTTRCEVVAAHEGRLWEADGASFACQRVRPALGDFEVLVVPGGPGAQELTADRSVVDWLRTFSPAGLAVSICTGALLWGAAGRLQGRRATTHASALELLAEHGATAVGERVVDEGSVITAGGVSCALDAGLHLVRELAGDEAARRIAKQMELGGNLVASPPAANTPGVRRR